MNDKPRRKILNECAGIETDSRVGSHNIITPVKTKDGIFKELQPDGIIPGRYEDYDLQNLLDLGVQLQEMHLDSKNKDIIKSTVEKFAQDYLNTLKEE